MYDEINLLFGFVLFILLFVAGYFLLSLTENHKNTLQFQVKLFAVSYVTRFAVSIAVYQFGLVKVLGDEDASGWFSGVLLQRQWERLGRGLVDLPIILAEAFKGHHRGYFYLLGSLFFVTGSPGRMPAAVLNCFIGALTVVFTYRIARSIFPDRVASRAGWFACFFPSLLIWSAQTVKEPVVILLESLALYGCVRLGLYGFSLRHIALCAFAIILLFPFRFYAAYLAGAVVALTLLLPRLSKGRSALSSGIAVACLAVPLLLFSGVLVRRETSLESYNLDSVQSFRRNVAVGQGSGSGVKQNYDLRNPVDFIMAISVGGAHLLLAPFPWQLGGGSLRMALTLPELIVWWWLFFAGVIPGFWFAIKKRFADVRSLLFFTAGLGLLYSAMFGNIGLVYRQRAQLLPWLFIFAAVGLEWRKMRRIESQQTKYGQGLFAGVRR